MNVQHRAAAIGKAVAALAIISAVAASCSSNGDAADARTTTADAPASPSTTVDPAPTSAPASPEDQAEIIAITKTYVTGLNNGDAKMLQHAMCQATLAQYTDLAENARPSPNPQQVNTITGIAVSGDLGFGTVEYTQVNDPTALAGTIPLAYKYEDGWKVCTEP